MNSQDRHIQNRVAIYCRLSDEDRNKRNNTDESGSIQNQKLMLIEYAQHQNWYIYNIYSDDDYSGSDRNRPAFNQMIIDAMDKKFNIILCKTQSRFTREIEMVEKYIHNLFPQWGIRFVSIVDHIDTDIEGNKKARQINGLINEWYLEDTSTSIKSALRTRMKSGYHIGSFAPYGYKKDENIKGHLIIDDKVAPIVREIFDMYIHGIGRTSIARELNKKGYISPSAYLNFKNEKQCIYHPSNNKRLSGLWTYNSVSNILSNEVYIGNLVQGKTYNPTYKSKHTMPAAKSHWVKVEHTHDAIIDIDTWNLAQKIWNDKSKPCYINSPQHSVNIFSGKVVCMGCGYNMITAYNEGKRYYRCVCAKLDKTKCNGSTIFETTLKKIVTEQIQTIINMYFDENAEKTIQDNIAILDDNQSKIKQLQIQNNKLLSEINNLTSAFTNLYLDKVKGLIQEEQFTLLSTNLTNELNNKQQATADIQKQIQHLNDIQDNKQNKAEILNKYKKFTELTKPMITELIDNIQVGGTKKDRKITINWNL